MFKWITIHLTKPICNCEEQDLNWGVDLTEDGRPQLCIGCKTCGTKHIVFSKKFIAGFELDQPYPGKKKEKPKLTVIPGGKVIPFHKRHKGGRKMTSFTAVVKPDHWDSQHYQLYYGFKNKNELELMEELIKYLNAKNDPKLNRLPPDMVDKTIEVLKFILEEELDNDIDTAIDNARALGVIP